MPPRRTEPEPEPAESQLPNPRAHNAFHREHLGGISLHTVLEAPIQAYRKRETLFRESNPAFNEFIQLSKAERESTIRMYLVKKTVSLQEKEAARLGVEVVRLEKEDTKKFQEICDQILNIDKLPAPNAFLKALKACNKQVAFLNEKVDGLQTHIGQIVVAAGDNEELLRQIETLTKDMKEAKEARWKYQKKSEDSEAEVTRLRATLKDLVPAAAKSTVEGELAALEIKLQVAKSKKDQYKTLWTAGKEELRTCKERMHKLTTAKDNESTAVEILKGQIAEANKKLGQQADEISAVEKKVDERDSIAQLMVAEHGNTLTDIQTKANKTQKASDERYKDIIAELKRILDQHVSFQNEVMAGICSGFLSPEEALNEHPGQQSQTWRSFMKKFDIIVGLMQSRWGIQGSRTREQWITIINGTVSREDVLDQVMPHLTGFHYGGKDTSPFLTELIRRHKEAINQGKDSIPKVSLSNGSFQPNPPHPIDGRQSGNSHVWYTEGYEFLTEGSARDGSKIIEVDEALHEAVNAQIQVFNDKSTPNIGLRGWADACRMHVCVRARGNGNLSISKVVPNHACNECVRDKVPCIMAYPKRTPVVLPLPEAYRMGGPTEKGYYIRSD